MKNCYRRDAESAEKCKKNKGALRLCGERDFNET